MLPSDNCDACTLAGSRVLRPASYFSHGFFLSIFFCTALLAIRKGLPAITPYATDKSHDLHIPIHNLEARPKSKSCLALSSKRLMTSVFATNIGLSAVLVALLLCEISNLLDPTARRDALNICLPLLMIQMVLVSPALQLQSVLAALGLNFATAGNKRSRLAWIFELIGLFSWLFGFWYVGDIVLHMYLRPVDTPGPTLTFSEGCLERIGVAGISLMASLSGFAAVSAVWHTFVARPQKVSDADINKRQTGIDATEEMIQAKQSRLRALDHKLSDHTSSGIVSSVLGTFRSSNDGREKVLLQMEIAGLEGMRFSMQNSLYALRVQKTEQERAKSPSGRSIIILTYIFAMYCAFRLMSISVNMVRRLILSTGWMHQSQSNDPVTFMLGVLAKHWDPELNRSAWTRQISFLLSGVLLLAAFNSALQTFLLLARAFPRLAASAANFRDSTTLALLISQVVAAYVISSAIMLRSNLPEDVGSVISDALGAPLESWRVEVWFNTWFLGTAGLTALGIWIGKKIRDHDDEEEFSEKRS
jgi:hypothetical protein